MLERQHGQLIAGVHEMYRLLKSGDKWPGNELKPASREDGHPATHQILEALGVLQSSPQHDYDAGDSSEEWQFFGQHPEDDGVANESYTPPSSTTQNQLFPPPVLPTAEAFTESHAPSLIERQRFKYWVELRSMEQYNSSMSQINRHVPNTLNGASLFSGDMAFPLQQQQPQPQPQQQHMFPDLFPNVSTYDDTMSLGGESVPDNGEPLNIFLTHSTDHFNSNASSFNDITAAKRVRH